MRQNPEVFGIGALLILNYPLAVLFNYLPNKAKNIFNIAVTAVYYTYLFNLIGYLQCMALCVLCYGICYLFKGSIKAPIAVIILSMGALSAKYYIFNLILVICTYRYSKDAAQFGLIKRHR
jgi:hypothetical protein